MWTGRSSHTEVAAGTGVRMTHSLRHKYKIIHFNSFHSYEQKLDEQINKGMG